MDISKEPDFPNVFLHVLWASLLPGIYSWTNRKLSAPFWRLYWNLNANASIRLRDIAVDLDPSTVALIPPYSPFDKSTRGPVDHFHIHFIAGPPFENVRDTIFSIPITEEIADTCRETIPVIQRNTYRDPWVISRLSFVVFWALRKVPWEAVSKTPFDARIEHVCRLMNQNSEHPLSNDHFSRELNMNTNAFIRLFKRATGISPHRYYGEKRIEKACVLLHSTTKSIDEIAAETGFADRFHFSRVFAGIVGLGPAGYRKIRT